MIEFKTTQVARGGEYDDAKVAGAFVARAKAAGVSVVAAGWNARGEFVFDAGDASDARRAIAAYVA